MSVAVPPLPDPLRGWELERRGAFAEAEASYRRAAAEGPDCARARVLLGLLLVSRGEYEQGWRFFESRETGPRPGNWHGEALEGRDITVTAEDDGLGDHIQFARWLPLLKVRGAGRVLYAPAAPLARLFRSIPGIEITEPRTLSPEELFAAIDRIEAGAPDLSVRSGSLPHIFDARPESIPPAPYLSAAPADIEQWRGRLPDAPLRVGLVWRGSPTHAIDVWRSLPSLRTLAPLWEVPGVAFVSLQKGAGEDEARAGIPGQPITHLGGEIQDFADTAAILEHLDLTISVDTSTAHAAGALGKPVWVLSPQVPDWRWRNADMVRRWYPTARVFPQHRHHDWSGAVQDVAAALREFKRAREGAKEGL